jgi:hypothetical protein
MALSERATKNKVAKPGASFACELVAAKPPHQPCNPPQIHHQNTTPKTILFPKHPSKTQQNQKIAPQIPSKKKRAET